MSDVMGCVPTSRPVLQKDSRGSGRRLETEDTYASNYVVDEKLFLGSNSDLRL